MKLNNQSVVLPIIIVSIIFVLFTDCASFDPYQTLGLKRGASVQDIRKAYKQKAKEWYSIIYFLSLIFTFLVIFWSYFASHPFRHPDKNKDELAETKFVEINKAYEVCTIIVEDFLILNVVKFFICRSFQIQLKKSYLILKELLMIV